MKTLFLVDAHALIYRYYYAFLGRPMRNRAGMNTSILFGFVKFLRDIQRREHPHLLGVAFDPKGGSFRREIFAEYKANRAETPEDVIESIPWVKRLVEAMCIPILEVPGYEADDVIGTLAHKGVEAGYRVVMVTPDKDYGQLVKDNCLIYKQKGDEIEIVDRAAVEAKYGIGDPALVRDILALWGDASDNIPGVAGIGEKTACKLVQEWGTVENILAHASEIKGKVGENIAASADQLMMSKRLATICLDVPIEFHEENLTLCEPNVEELRKLYTELDFRIFLRDLPVDGNAPQAQVPTDLFGNPIIAPPTKTMIDRPIETFVEEEYFPTLADVPHTYHTVHTAEELQALLAKIATYPEFCFDTETTGFDVFNDRIVGLSLAVAPHEAWYVPFTPENTAAYATLIKPLFENPAIAKIAQNAKFDAMVLSRLGVEIRGRVYDTMLLHYLLDPESRHGMDALAMRYLNYRPIPITDLVGRGAKQLTMDRVALERVAEYAAEDADVTLQLKHVLWPEVERAGLAGLYLDIEEPMIDVLARIEMAGVKLDCDFLAEYAVELNAKLTDLETEIRHLADEPGLNINSPRQLGEVLFGKMKLTDKPKKTGTKQYSTDEEYLQSFAASHPIVARILEYRGIKKLISTYVEALPQLVNRTTGKLHTSFNQAVTATGRLSSTNPNLQNIPIRDELGRPIRRAFIPSDADHVILSADYSQVELRLMAHLSGDEALISAFEQGEDIHTATAARLFNKSLSEVTPDERRKAKTANFGIIYGISAFGLSQRLGIPRGEANEIIEGYFASYPGVKRYMDDVVTQAEQDGYVSTLFGRRRHLPDIHSHNANVRGLAQRNAINAPIQGSAADIIKIAMARICRRFAEENIQSRVILQVHDELVVDTLRSEESRVREIVIHEMQSAAPLRVPLIVDCNTGQNWLQAH